MASKKEEPAFRARREVNGEKVLSPDPALKITIPDAPSPIFKRQKPGRVSNDSAPSTEDKPKDHPDVAAPVEEEDAEGEAEATHKTYMERIRTKLGDDYQTVERYRLGQDERKEKHWKVC